MDKQYSVKFFASLIESIQKVCRDYLDFEQAVDISGYLCVEIDSYRKERYVLSELIQNTGDIVSESYCTKAFKTLKKFPSDVGGIENSELTRLSASAETSNISRINSRRCESSSRTSGYNTSNTESGFCTNQRNPYKLLPPGLKRTIPWQNRSSPKRERNESYRISQENSEDYSNVHHSGSNNYLPEPASDSIVLPVNTLDNTSSSASVAENSTCNTVPSVNETIRLPLNVKVKEENDSSFMDEQGYENTRMYSDKNSQNSYIHAQTENNETLPTSSSLLPGDQENAHTARKMKGHVKLFQNLGLREKMRKPKRDRAAYMRMYRWRIRQKQMKQSDCLCESQSFPVNEDVLYTDLQQVSQDSLHADIVWVNVEKKS